MVHTLVLIVAGWVFVSLVAGVALGTSIRRLRDRSDVVSPARWTATPAGLVVPAVVPPARRTRRR